MFSGIIYQSPLDSISTTILRVRANNLLQLTFRVHILRFNLTSLLQKSCDAHLDFTCIFLADESDVLSLETVRHDVVLDLE